MANEKRLIDANAIPWEEHYVPDGDTQWEYKKDLVVSKSVIDAMPTVDAVEVVHGRWEKPSKYGMGHKFNYLGVVCSACASWMDNPYNYCPNCGAKMDEEA